MLCCCVDPDEALSTHLHIFFNEPGVNKFLKEPVNYVLQGGKRIRPKISFDIYNTLRNETCVAVSGICFLATEYLHSASLIVDDLPCMDNAKTRRGNECIHLKYSQAIAQLTTGALLALSTHSLAFDLDRASDVSKDTVTEITMHVLKIISSSLFRVSDGQLLDLSVTDADLGNVIKNVSENVDVKEIILKKTGTLFQMCFELGWILGTGSTRDTEKIRKLADLFAMAFQIADDIEDYDIDLQTNKKNVSQNYAIYYGKETAVRDGNVYLDQFCEKLDELKLSSPFFHELVSSLRSKLV